MYVFAFDWLQLIYVWLTEKRPKLELRYLLSHFRKQIG